MDTDPWRVTPDGLELSVRLTPRGGRDQIEGLVEIDGQAALRARVAAPPVGGGANAALVRLLAATAGVAKGRVDIAGGACSRLKRVSVRGDPEALAERLGKVLRSMPTG